MQQSLGVIGSADPAASMLQPIRLRLLETFREPRSAAEAARLLDQPRQRLGHHVRALEQSGLLRQVGERRSGNFVERILQSSARSYVILPEALGAIGADRHDVQDRFASEYLLAAASGILRDVAALRARADREGKKLATLALETEVNFATPADQAAFAREAAECLADLAARYHTDGEGRRFRFTLAGLPAVRRSASPPESSDENAH